MFYILGVVKISHTASSDKDVKDIIKVWLKYAPERIRNYERRLNKHASQTQRNCRKRIVAANVRNTFGCYKILLMKQIVLPALITMFL